MNSYPAEKLRNVGLFSHQGHGKTTLAETLLFNAGSVSRLGRVDDGTTASDYDPEETRRHISIQLSLLPLEWKGNKINLVDSPGYADFLGEVLEAARVVDSAIIMFEAVSGVEVGAERAWGAAAARDLPRLIVIGKMDRENADFQRTLGQVVEKFGPHVVPIQLPIGAQDAFSGVVDLVRMKAYTGPDLAEGEIPGELRADAEAAREKLIEAAAEGDDELLTKYLDGNELSDDEIRAGLRAGVTAGAIFPVLCAAPLSDRATRPILDAIVDYLPSPAARGAESATEPESGKKVESPPSADAPLAALVFKSTADPYVGKLSYFRVFSGVLHSDSHVWNASRGQEERLGQLFVIHGKTQEPVPQLGPGELGAVAKLQDVGVGDTLSSHEHPRALDPIAFPEPLVTMAVQPKTKADLDKLGTALARLAEEDPTIRVSKEPDTGETLLEGLGESHLEISAERMHRKFGVEVVLSVPRVPFKETIHGKATAEYKHKKQTGGHGQYGHVFLEIEPLSRGAGFEFAERVVGGAVPRNYIPAVEKGVREALPKGFLAGFPVVDVKVTLFDGSYHSVDSSEMAFKIAADQAFRKCLEQAQPVLLEPMVDLEVTVPDQYVGEVMGDLNTRRARVQGMFPGEDGVSVIQAQAPQAEIQRYATDLRSLTQGRGVFTAKVASYEEVPAHAAQSIIAEVRKEHGD